MSEVTEVQEVPPIITDDFFKITLAQTDELVKELRSEENYSLANQIIRLATVSENLFFQLKGEQKKIQECLENSVDANGRIEEAIKISQRDQDVIKKLQDEVTSAWSTADAAKLREQHIHESLNQTREKYFALIEQNKKLAVKYEETDELGENAATVLQQCDRLQSELTELNKRLFMQRAYSDEIQKKLEDSNEKNNELYREWDTATNESLSNRKKVETLTHSLAEMKEELETVTDNLNHYRSQSESLHKRIKDREQKVAELRENLTKISTDNAILNALKSKLELSVKSSKSEVTKLNLEIAQFQNYLRLKDDEGKKLLLKYENEVKRVESLEKKITSLEKIISKNELEAVNKKNEIHTIEKERELIRKANDDMKKENDKLQKKIEHQINDMEKLNASINDLKQERASIFEEKSKIASELKSSRETERKAQLQMKKLQSNFDKSESEKKILNESFKQLNEELDEKKKLFDAAKLELSEAREKIQHFKHEYNSALKNLKDIRSDNQRCIEREADFKDRMWKCKKEVDDMNTRLAGKIEEVISLMKNVQKLEKLNRGIKRDHERCLDSLKIVRGEVKNLRQENKIQKNQLRENDANFIKMKAQLDKMLRERDLIANQMFRKTDENGILEQKVSMLKLSMDRGDSLYKERMDDINVMRNETLNLRSQCNVLKRAMENTFDMRHETLQLHRKLNQERTKVRALEEEMLTPMNVHRWRKLKWRDPERLNLMKKSQKYQKLAFMRMVKLSKCEGIVKEMEEKYSELQKKLERYSNVDVQRRLFETKSQLSLNTKRMKCAIALSRASECDLTSKDHAINQLQQDLAELKSQLFKEKHAKNKLAEKLGELKKKKNLEDCGKKMIDFKNLGNKFKIGIMKG